MKTIAYVGNKNRHDYYRTIMEASVNRTKTYDLMNSSDEQVAKDLFEADQLVVIGDWYELPKDARDIMGFAHIIGKPITCYNDVPSDFQKVCVVNFCMGIADGILDELLKGEDD